MQQCAKQLIVADHRAILHIVCVCVCVCVCRTWSVKLRAENRLWEFENRVLRKTVGYMWEEVAGDWRKLRN